MSIRPIIPRGCKTPSRDRDEYTLTKKDAQFMQASALKIWQMLSYYCNMPENRTGEVQSGPAASEIIMNELLPTLNSIIDDLNCMTLL